MNKKTLIITAIITAISTSAYIFTRPKPPTDCERLLLKGLDAKTQAEKDYADKQWRTLCVTNQS